MRKALGTRLASICLTTRIFAKVGLVANLQKSSKSFRRKKQYISFFIHFNKKKSMEEDKYPNNLAKIQVHAFSPEREIFKDVLKAKSRALY